MVITQSGLQEVVQNVMTVPHSLVLALAPGTLGTCAPGAKHLVLVLGGPAS